MTHSLPCNSLELSAALAFGWQPSWCFFWHASRPAGCFSQWWPHHPFRIDGLTYRTAEHWMMAEKARLFGDTDALDAILAAPDPGTAKKLGRCVLGFDNPLWETAREGIVLRGNLEKFRQHRELRIALVATGSAILAEASPTDRIWDTGVPADHPDTFIPARWPGLNLLGFLLMKVRSSLA
jgi:ribA/ribD-fused uncharacterized protein